MEKLGERGADALRELFNIGAGHAATSLSEMLGKERVNVDVPTVRYVPLADIPRELGDEKQVYCAVGFTITGGLDAWLLVLFDEGSARRLSAVLLGKPVPPDGDTVPLDLAAKSALDETGNIVASSFVSGLGRLTRRRIMPSTPISGIDNADNALERLTTAMRSAVSQPADQSIVCCTDFTTRGTRIHGHLLLVPERRSLADLLTALGVDPAS